MKDSFKEAVKEIVQKIGNGFYYLGDLIASSAAKYHKYWDEQNAIARATAKQQQINDTLTVAQQYFYTVLDVFANALANCAETIGASIPSYPYKLVGIPSMRVAPNGIPVYRFRFRYRRGVLTANQMKKILQSELNQECYVRGIPQLIITGLHLGEDGIAIVEIVWASQLQAAHARVRKS